ncbi:MAG: fibronectin type III domain-containing protein [Defluviitaleaceae bacterium]|nr:fibronectin type III domain-containing protein [Defluviitaleaceae bacterium]
MKFHSVKKKVALWLAIVMFFGVVAPFGLTPSTGLIQAFAHPATGTRLEARLDSRLVFGTPGTNVEYRHVPDQLPDGSVFLQWAVSNAVNALGMHVLRFFTENGDKIELWVRHVPGAAEIEVHYHFFPRLDDVPPAVIYDTPVTVFEPLRHTMGIGNGIQFDCGVSGETFRFLWSADAGIEKNFMFYMDNLPLGAVHGFTLEFYTGANADNYFFDVTDPLHTVHEIHAHAWLPNTAGVGEDSRAALGWPLYVASPTAFGGNDRVFVFPGFSVRDIDVIPFASVVDITDPSETLFHTVGNQWQTPPASLLGGTFAGEIPSYTTRDLNMVIHDEYPGMADNGLDIRIALPRFFDEETGRFNVDFRDGIERNIQPTIAGWTPDIYIHVGSEGTAETTEAFTIFIPNIAEVVSHSAITAAFLTAVNPARHAPAPNHIQLLDADILTAQAWGRDLGVLRLQIGGLMPSIIYDEITLAVQRAPIFNAPRDGSSFYHRGTAGNRINLNTLLRYTLPNPIAGTVSFRVTPFRWHCQSVYPSMPYIAGTYVFDPLWVGGGNPIPIHFDGLSDVMHIPISFHSPPASVRRYTIHFDAAAAARVQSQTVIIRPVDRPSLGPPNRFSIEREHYRVRRVSPDQPQGLEADLTYRVEWEMGLAERLFGMFEEWGPTGPTGTVFDSVTVTYGLFRSSTPVANDAELFAEINVRMTDVPASAGQPRRIFAEYSIYYPDTGLTVPAGEGLLRQEGHFMLGEVTFSDLTALHVLAYNPAIADPYRFPGIYYMFVQPRWEQFGNNPRVELEDAWPRSPFASLTLDDFDQLTPPPPAAFTATTQTNPNEPPMLNVSFNVPTPALRAYRDHNYVFAPLVLFNVYISAFEDEINRIKTAPTSVHEDYTLAFVDEIDTDGSINLSDYLGALRSGEVLRIIDIPLMPAAEFNAMDWMGRWDYANDRDAILDATARAIHTTLPFPLAFSLTGLDENQRYFLFADMVVDRYVTTGAALTGEIAGDPIMEQPPGTPPPPLTPVSRRSVPSALTGDVTIGTPQVPGPGEVIPPAPGGLSHCKETLTQTEVTLYWDNIISEDPAVVAIEFEILRVTDRIVNFDPYEETPLADIVNGRADAIGWRTNQRRHPFLDGSVPADNNNPLIDILRHGQSTAQIPLNSPSELYAFEPRRPDHPNQVTFTDRTLRPNNLYFYYVRTVRRVILIDPVTGEPHTLENRSSWVEESVTALVVQPPQNLREEDGGHRPGFDPETQVLVSWTHPAMETITTMREPDETLVFEYQIRADGDPWGDIIQVPIASLINPSNLINNRFHLLLRNLTSGTNYQMRVRLTDRATGDTSVWSNVLTFITAWDDNRFQLERDTDNWLDHLRRLLMDQVRRPFWIAVDTPALLRVVYRPDAFRALVDAPGAAIPLHNTDAVTSIYYLPVSGILEANENRKGFSSAYDDMEVIFAPRFLNQEHNRAIMDMTRHVSSRNVNINDYFVRITLQRQTIPGNLHGTPPLGDAVDVRIDLVGVNTNTRDIRTWDTQMTNRATQLIEDRASNPVIRQNIRNLVERGEHNNERAEYLMLDYLATVENALAAEISRMILRDIPPNPNSIGIIAPQQIPVAAFDAAIHIVSTGNGPDVSVTAFTQTRGGANPEWQPLPAVEHANGVALTAQAPGLYAFAGQTVNVPGIENVPHGNAITAMIARYGLAGLFPNTIGIDLHRNATRHEVVGSIARLANAPASADPMTWVSSNLNVPLANRNANGLVSQQEAIALVMALYENKTRTRIDSIIIRNHANTAGMTLDARYAQAVRAAFELGIVDDRELRPASPVTVGDFFNMLATLDGKVGL